MTAIYTIIAHDLLVAGVSLWLTLRLRFGSDVPAEFADSLFYGIPLFVVIAGLTFHAAGMYRALWRYASIPDLTLMVRAATAALLMFWLVVFATAWLDMIPRSLPVIQWLVLVVLLATPRLVVRMRAGENWPALFFSNAPCIPVLVAGATEEASMFVRASQGRTGSPYKVLGILDDSGEFVGRSLHRVPIAGRLDQLRDVVSRLAAGGARPTQLVIATPGASPEAIARLIEEAAELGLNVSRVPRITRLAAAEISPTAELRPVRLEDLLGRPQVELDRVPVVRLVEGRRVLITGAGGSIGSELSRQIAALAPSELVLLEASEFNLYDIDQKIRTEHPELSVRPVLCNIRDEVRIENVFARHQPELIFHAAALKHVPLVEANPCDGILTNAIGTKIIADAAMRHRVCAMVQVSTDKAIRPESVMGASKHLAESYCQALDCALGASPWGAACTRFMTVRFGNVLGSSGSVLPLFQRQLSQGGPLTVTHAEMRRFFMTISEAVELTLHASAHGLERREHRGQIFVLDMGEPIKIIDIARQLVRLAGLRPDEDVKIEITGLRPGERLEEHLFDDAEEQIKTSLAGVLQAISAAPDLAVIDRELEELHALAVADRPDELRAVLSRLVPSYPNRRRDAVKQTMPGERVFDRAPEPIPRFVAPVMPLTIGK